MNQNQAAPAARAASGPETITVEKHKVNFLALHGPFENKDSQNISRWIKHADDYQKSHMIPSLEMALIVVHCIRGEPARKIRRILDVPGTAYVNSNHFSQQELQEAITFKPYRDHVPRKEAVENAENPALSTPMEPEVLARPTIHAVRCQPEVTPENCLRQYLLTIYKKKVNLTEADKFRATFKKQKSKQSCSNFLDEFIINYENYSYLRWTNEQRNGNGTAALPGNQDVRNVDSLQLEMDGLCNEFKNHSDNVQFIPANFAELEAEVIRWQRETQIGKTFTATCLIPPGANAFASALDWDQTHMNSEDPTANFNFSQLDLQTDSPPITSAAFRGRGAGRGTRRRQRWQRKRRKRCSQQHRNRKW